MAALAAAVALPAAPAARRCRPAAAAAQPRAAALSAAPAPQRCRHTALLQHSRPAAAAPQPRRRRAAQVCRAAAAVVDVETARKQLDGPALVLDVRPAAQFEDSRITKPARKTANAPFAAGQDGGAWLAAAAGKLPGKAARVIVMCATGGADSAEAAALLAGAGYANVAQMEGGFEGYSAVWSPSGKRRPPAGRWVSTGKEALKSGLNIPGVAESYTEGGDLRSARWAQGLAPGEQLPD